jgi:hypothetical protein
VRSAGCARAGCGARTRISASTAIGPPSTAGHDRAPVHEAVPRDIAVDFVDMTSLVERIETSFFTSEP